MIQETITLPLPHLSRSYTFFHTSDCHVAYAAPQDSPEARAKAHKYATFWCPSGPLPPERFEETLRIADETRADGLFLCGDVADYYSPSTVRYIREHLTQAATEALYVPGNHEGSDYGRKVENIRGCYPEYADMMQHSPACWARDYGDFLVVGIDNGDKKIQESQLAFLEAQLARQRPILLLLHIPLITPAIEGPVKAKWGENGCDYFTLGQEKDTELSRKFCEIIKQPDNSIAAIFAGHIHLSHAGEFAPGKMQYVSAPTYLGKIWRVNLICAE